MKNKTTERGLSEVKKLIRTACAYTDVGFFLLAVTQNIYTENHQY